MSWLGARGGPDWQAIVMRNHWALAIMLAGLLGLIEGALTAPHGEGGGIGRWTYWGILFSFPSIALAASLGVRRSLAHLPLVIVVQDWLSLVGQGKAPQDERWYEAVFGQNFLTVHGAYLPNFYYIGFVTTLALHMAIDIHETWRPKPWSPRKVPRKGPQPAPGPHKPARAGTR